MLGLAQVSRGELKVWVLSFVMEAKTTMQKVVPPNDELFGQSAVYDSDDAGRGLVEPVGLPGNVTQFGCSIQLYTH